MISSRGGSSATLASKASGKETDNSLADLLANIDGVLGKSADDIFTAFAPSEVKAIHNAIQTRLVTKKEEVRTLVGTKYRDLVQTADTIIDIDSILRQNDALLRRLCDGADARRAYRFFEKEYNSLPPPVVIDEEYVKQLKLSCLSGISRCVFSHISGSNSRNVVLAARLTVLFDRIASSMDESRKLKTISSRFNVYKQQLTSLLTQKIGSTRGSSGREMSELKESVHAYILLKQRSPAQALNDFVRIRLEHLTSLETVSGSSNEQILGQISGLIDNLEFIATTADLTGRIFVGLIDDLVKSELSKSLVEAILAEVEQHDRILLDTEELRLVMKFCEKVSLSKAVVIPEAEAINSIDSRDLKSVLRNVLCPSVVEYLITGVRAILSSLKVVELSVGTVSSVLDVCLTVRGKLLLLFRDHSFFRQLNLVEKELSGTTLLDSLIKEWTPCIESILTGHLGLLEAVISRRMAEIIKSGAHGDGQVNIFMVDSSRGVNEYLSDIRMVMKRKIGPAKDISMLYDSWNNQFLSDLAALEKASEIKLDIDAAVDSWNYTEDEEFEDSYGFVTQSYELELVDDTSAPDTAWNSSLSTCRSEINGYVEQSSERYVAGKQTFVETIERNLEAAKSDFGISFFLLRVLLNFLTTSNENDTGESVHTKATAVMEKICINLGEWAYKEASFDLKKALTVSGKEESVTESLTSLELAGKRFAVEIPYGPSVALSNYLRDCTVWLNCDGERKGDKFQVREDIFSHSSTSLISQVLCVQVIQDLLTLTEDINEDYTVEAGLADDKVDPKEEDGAGSEKESVSEAGAEVKTEAESTDADEAEPPAELGDKSEDQNNADGEEERTVTEKQEESSKEEPSSDINTNEGEVRMWNHRLQILADIVYCSIILSFNLNNTSGEKIEETTHLINHKVKVLGVSPTVMSQLAKNCWTVFRKNKVLLYPLVK